MKINSHFSLKTHQKRTHTHRGIYIRICLCVCLRLCSKQKINALHAFIIIVDDGLRKSTQVHQLRRKSSQEVFLTSQQCNGIVDSGFQ